MIKANHNFADAMTTQLTWYVQNYDLIWSLFLTYEWQVFSQILDQELINLLWNRSQACVPVTAVVWEEVGMWNMIWLMIMAGKKLASVQ